MNYEKLFRLTNITGVMHLIIWIYSYTRAALFIRMENFQSLFIKKRQTSLCTSLFAHSIKDILSRIMFGVNWNDMCAITRRKKTSKNSEHDFSIDCVIEDLRSTFLHVCFNTSHIRKGINCSIQKFLFLLFVNHSLYRKQKGGSLRKGRKRSPARKGQRKLPTNFRV